MPQILRTIDEIAIAQGRDVLFLKFFLDRKPLEDFPTADDIASHTSRNVIMAWLNQRGIDFEECFHIDSGHIIHPYVGELYLDIPFDETLSNYQALASFLEDESGRCRFEYTEFFCLPLASAEKIYQKRAQTLEQELGK